MMKFDEYQAAADRVSGGHQTTPDMRVMTAGLGLAGESGEVCDILKKHFRHGHPLADEKLVEELGDVLWYIAEIASAYGWDLEAIALGNLAKLRRRYPNGFTQERSLHRST